MSSKPPQLRDQATVRNGLRIAGPALFGIGLILTIIAFADFLSAFSSFGASMPTNFGLAFIGLPLMAVGGAMIRVGYLGPATRYVAGEVAPTIKEALGYVGVGAATLTCAKCGGANKPDARFCDHCGAALSISCPSCGNANAPDATFCNQCGKPLTPA
jgi:hypothetical protein